MKIQFRSSPVPQRLHGWKRVLRRAHNILRGTLVVDFGRITMELAN
ncbi:MAG: hypothetical protein P4L99_19000 [Chthoniobacter sp.]|nr:hypothetical protein [Chthoniobacter sp.]